MEHYEGIIKIKENAYELPVLNYVPVYPSFVNIHLFKEGATTPYGAFDFYFEDFKEFDRLRALINNNEVQQKNVTERDAVALGIKIDNENTIFVIAGRFLFVFYKGIPERIDVNNVQ